MLVLNFAQRRYRHFLTDKIYRPYNWFMYVGIAIFTAYAVIDYLTIGSAVLHISCARFVFGVICFAAFVKHNPKRSLLLPLVEAGYLIISVFIVTAVCLVSIDEGISHYQSGLLFIMLYVTTLSRMPLYESLVVIATILFCYVCIVHPPLKHLNPTDADQDLSNLYLLAIISVASCYRRNLEFQSYYSQTLQLRRQAIQLKAHTKMLTELSETDQLTRLHNRQYLDKVVEVELAKYESYGVLMLDIDHFKKINDFCGHLTGDRVIQDVSRFIKGSISPESHAIRYGGEEFLIVVPNISSTLLFDKAERLRKQIAEHCSVSSSICLDLKITISVGIAHAEDNLLSLEKVIDRADQALYQSKRGGRDCSTLFV